MVTIGTMHITVTDMVVLTPSPFLPTFGPSVVEDAQRSRDKLEACAVHSSRLLGSLQNFHSASQVLYLTG